MTKENGKVAVITGGSGGIGEALCGLFAARGWRVCNLSRTNPQGREDFIACDVADGDSVAAAFGEVEKRYGRVDLLINNAGVGISGATELLPFSEAERVFAIDFFGAYRCVRAALPLMGKGGKIVNVSSACALFALPFRTVYCAAKAALSMLSYGLAMELKASGITVAAVCPGDTKTGFTKNRIKYRDTSPRYGDRVVSAASTVDSREDKRMPVGKVADKIYRFCVRRRLKPCYIVGGKYRALYAVSRLLPAGALLAATGKLFGGRG